MTGNVSEWCDDWYDTGEYAKGKTSTSAGPSVAKVHVLRGGSWADDFEPVFRCAVRLSLGRPHFIYGFRAVQTE